jgi:hypothetical protein
MICVPITNQVTGYPFEVQPTENKRQELPWLIRLKVSIGVLEKLREKIKLHQQNAPRLWEK